MKRILCFGDSLTWGFIPGTMGQRYGPDVRWPRVMAGDLGENYEIIEEALNGRATIFDDAFRPGRNGLKMLGPLLESHYPLDLVIIMLGSNDHLHYRDMSSFDVGRGIMQLIDMVRRTITVGQPEPPPVLIVSPPYGEKLTPEMAIGCKGELHKFEDLSSFLEGVAKDKGCHFFDGSGVVTRKDVSDGIHMNEKANKILARHITSEVRSIFGDAPG